MSKIFKLTNVYEKRCVFDTVETYVRIEIFEDIDNTGFRRVTVWAKRSYDAIPTIVNLEMKNDKKIVSSDLLMIDITSLITEDSSLITGKEIDESQILKLAVDGIDRLCRE